jgi:hypothetical protein
MAIYGQAPGLTGTAPAHADGLRRPACNLTVPKCVVISVKIVVMAGLVSV